MIRERLLTILLSPIVSEKTTIAAEMSGQYAFRVAADATKREIGDAVEALFEVEVEQVRVLNVKGKTKRFGRHTGKRRDVRKAYVRLKPGHSIDLGSGA